MRCCIALYFFILLSACSAPIKKDIDKHVNDESAGHVLKGLCLLDDADSAAMADWHDYSLWMRIQDSYALEPIQNDRISREIKRYSKHNNYLIRVTDRGAPYLFHIVEQLDTRGMPAELAFLPIVESAFDPFAYSSGRASGMWQIIPGTGEMLGLKQTWWYDGRRDIVASTDAALNYLEQLHKRFDGDWLLALAAYNSGAGTVNRAIRKNKKKGKATDYWSLDLPTETERYVPKLLALADIFSHANSAKLNLPYIANEPYFAAVDVEAQIDLAQAATLANLDMEQFYRLNPAFNRWATDPDGPHHLLIPTTQHSLFTSQLADLPPESRVKWQRHLIKQGESLSSIAAKYDVSLAAIQSANKLNSSMIRAGKTLLVPVARADAEHYSQSVDQRLTQKQLGGGKRGDTKVEHTVTRGDSFWSLSRKYGVSTEALAKWNNMAPRDTLREGKTLVVWSNKTSINKEVTDAQVIRKLQ